MGRGPDIADWLPAHVGFANDGLVIDGIEVWKQAWRSVGVPPVALPHPAHPRQLHAYDVHDVGEEGAPVRFAACELSNGVWGFHVPPDSLVASPGVRLEGTHVTRHLSPDGTIRVDLAEVEWSNSHWVASPQVVEIASDRVVLDLWGTDWDATVAFRVPATARLGLRRYRRAGTLVAEIDVARDAFRIVIDAGQAVLPGTSLLHLAAALEDSSRQADVLAAQDIDERPSPGRAVHALSAWRTALAILAAALLVITAITSWVVHQSSPPTRKLDTVPVMPKP